MKGETRTCDLLVIGTGMAGMAAALFAAKKGITTIQVGLPGGINFAGGLLDLMAVHPVGEKRPWKDPWACIRALVQDEPAHPYAKIAPEAIRTALSEVTQFLAAVGLPYTGYGSRNVQLLTPAGTVKTTYRVPLSMWKGVDAWIDKSACLLVDFQGMKGFSARQIAEIQKPDWPGLRSARIALPGFKGEAYPVTMARALESPDMGKVLVKAVKPHLQGESVVGFPAFLGFEDTARLIAFLETELGLQIFEIPTMPPSLGGLRLQRAFEKGLPTLGVQALYQKQVRGVERLGNGDFRFEIGGADIDTVVRAKGAVLATGRFFGKGLHAHRTGIRETVFGLPVRQPESRTEWHHPDFLSPAGHPVNRAGLETDEWFRPLGEDGAPAYRNLFAAGSILAHQDWMRMKCGSGLAIATAFKAVAGFLSGG